ncbi:MAG: hypothetical protein M1834_006218 [Cirrosporium novae-zelandiae]|nr:MAG: hypothetical protein M1834_006218 [Cirrosporium novae-zelandiae]
MASVPLLCSICPKKPTFSDISHLLTHVGSKGHLSHYFKLQVRSRSEAEARDQLDTYDRWYNNNDFERLLSERMHQKETKKPRTSTMRRKKAERPLLPKRQNPSATTTPVMPFETPDYLDPRLSQDQCKVEQDDFLYQFPASDNILGPDARLPKMHLWQTSRDRLHEAPHLLPSQPIDIFGLDVERPQNETSPSYGSPSMESYSQLFYLKPHENILKGLSNPFDIEIEDTDTNNGTLEIDEPEEEGSLTPSHSAKLKGVYWPGMNIFDSATPETKRKRNQKKDGTNLQQMLITSATVEPTERIYTPDGVLKKERLISGMIDSSSPLQGETPVQKRRRGVPKKKPLAEHSTSSLNTNTRENKHHYWEKPSNNIDLYDIPRQALTTLDSPPSSPSYGGGHYFTSKDDELEFKLTVKGLTNKKRRGFTVFEDQPISNGGVDRTSQLAHRPSIAASSQRKSPFTQGRDLAVLNSEFRPHNSLIPSGENISTFNQQRSTFQPQGHPYQVTGKENIEPLGFPGVSDLSVRTSRNWNPQRSSSVPEAYQHHFFHTQPSMHYGIFSGHEVPGLSFNPLSFSFQQHQAPNPPASQRMHVEPTAQLRSQPGQHFDSMAHSQRDHLDLEGDHIINFSSPLKSDD